MADRNEGGIMKLGPFKVIGGVAALLASAWCSGVRADFQSVTGSAAPSGVSMQQPSMVNLAWDVRVQFPFPPNAPVDQVGSSTLEIGIPSGAGCQPLQTLQRAISDTIQLAQAAPFNGSATLSEQVEISRALVAAARQRGANAIALCRTFQESLSVNTFDARVLLPIRSGGIDATDFALTYIRMRFDDGAVSRLVETGTPLRIDAEIQYQGRGLLRARWEVADPGSTRGAPLYRPLSTVHRYLTGDGRTVLQGPQLPTQLSGLHLVRLRILEPQIDAPGLVLRYFVQGGSNRLPADGAVELIAPPPGTRLDRGIELKWGTVPGAVAYRLEFLIDRAGVEDPLHWSPDGSASPDAAQLVPGDRAHALLSRMVSSRIAGRTGHWRVVALGDEGRPIATSPWRPFVADGEPHGGS